jgi:hypothetical protein
MNRYLNILAFLSSIVATAHITVAADPSGYAITNEVRMTDQLMKGAELYCWQTDAGEWNYALLRGTNLNKTDETIRAPSGTITSLDALKARLAVLAEGEWLSWGRNYSLPPEDIQKEIMDYCRTRGIKLN